MRSLAVLVSVAACGPSGEALDVHYTYSIGPEQACATEDGDPVTSCADISMTCDSVLMVRVVDADDPARVYINECNPINNSSPADNLCPIAELRPSGQIPTSRVAIQIAVYPLAALQLNADLEPICPDDVQFTLTGFSTPTNAPQPALAGMAYTDGYDDAVVIELGCNNTRLIDTVECRDENALDVIATVVDFDGQIPVDRAEALDIAVRVGEPHRMGDSWEFVNDDAEGLSLGDDAEPMWAADNLDLELVDYVCLQVEDDGDNGPSTLSCRPVLGPAPNMLDLLGQRVSASTVDEILDAMALPGLPRSGLVIGKVVKSGAGLAGATVTDAAGTPIEYLSADRKSVGGNATSSNGIFIATTPPFEAAVGAPNTWSATAPQSSQLNEPIGGQIDSRLTIVIIQMGPAF